MNDEVEEIERTSAEDSPWAEFAIKTMHFDKAYDEPSGYHWLKGIYYWFNVLDKYPKFDIEQIRSEIDDEHWFKKESMDFEDVPQCLIAPLNDLGNKLGDTSHAISMDFSKTSFDALTNFSNFIFPVTASFEHSEFSGKANFNFAFFKRHADFNGTKFRDNANFYGVKFCQISEFANGEFFKEANFVKATFSIGNFLKATFYNTANFAEANFLHSAGFKRVKFLDLADFNSATFTGGTNFAYAQFEIHTPIFYDAKPNADITWKNATWPSMDRKTHKDLIDQNQSAYENLAYHMKTVEKYHDQHFFFRQEMRCRRKLGGFFNWLVYGLYELLSDYGYGVGRAFIAWSLHIVLGAIAIMITAFCAGMGLQENLFCSVSVSVTNANPYVFLGVNEGSLMKCYDRLNELSPMIFGAIRGIQTILGIAFLFLLLLTLRVRFRLR